VSRGDAFLWAWAASDAAHEGRLRGSTLTALVLMDRWARPDGTCQLRIGRLCGELRENKRTVTMAVTAIERAGYYRRAR
jgi:hypothetical protein